MTAQDILEEPQVTKGTFYHHFDSKTALLAGMFTADYSAIIGGISW